ncbi:hypothetical protein WJX72_006529 [[Myrmecia] bisecta]|uniref:Xaa-Pro dipeptidase n=1 Tax=[Myrmecia] bisecta TaxID=41462 RepID=A0AAW1Q0G3_9CHLO
MTLDADPCPANCFQMGPNTLRISRSNLHGKLREKFVKAMLARAGGSAEALGVVLLQGGGPAHIYNTDMEGLFRQESYFHYLFGVEVEDYFGAIDLQTGRSLLFMPRLPDSYAVWMGQIPGPDAMRTKYGVSEVHYVDEMASVLQQLKPAALHVLNGVNSDSGRRTQAASFEGMDEFNVDISDTLFEVLMECRVHKTPEELEVMRYANVIASNAHIEVMRKCRPGLMEYAAESIFLHDCYLLGGARFAAYTPICASGPNGAILHYGHAGAPNNRQIADGDMLLLDMGCEYYRYASDITVSFPVNGRFTDDQKVVYEAVLSAYTAVLQSIKPGVRWPDMQLLAERRLLTALAAGGFLKGSVEEMLEHRIAALFMPHGLGHFLGLDTHDVGGYPKHGPPRIDKPGLRSLRTARVLEEGMVITVEPGCYFNAYLLEPAFSDPVQSKYLHKSRIKQFMGFGGVRLEDDVIVTAAGAESMTSVPRTVEEVEAVMAGGPWPAE